MSMKELSSKFLSLLWYVPYIIDEKPKIQRFWVVYLLVSRRDLNLIIQRPLKRQWEMLTSVTNKVRIRNNTYLTGKVREPVTLIIKENVLILIKASEIILRIFLRIIIKEQILKVKHSRTLQHQKVEKCLILMLKTMNKKNL